jgi:hypothetical protein
MEYFLKKALHRGPGTAVGVGVVSNIWNVMRIGGGIRKRVVGSAKNQHLPVHVALTHLILKSLDLAGGHKCVVSAGAYQNFTLDIRRIARAGGIQTAVE